MLIIIYILLLRVILNNKIINFINFRIELLITDEASKETEFLKF
jgi:hypothetical protein